MTERAAWLKLAKLWNKPLRGVVPYVRLRHGAHGMVGRNGLCACVTSLYVDGKIDHDARLDMNSKVHAAIKHGAYAWPLTLAGAKSRAAFCRRMAAKCTAKEKVTK